jgi:hypothetical protein
MSPIDAVDGGWLGLRGPGAVDETNTWSPPALEQRVDCIGQWAHVGDEPLIHFTDRDWLGTVGYLDSAIFGGKQIEGTNGILKN